MPKQEDPLKNLDTQFSAREIITAAGQVALFEKLSQEETLAFGRGITRILAWANEVKLQKRKNGAKKAKKV